MNSRCNHSYVIYYDDKSANIVVSTDLVSALSRITSERLEHIVKIDCPPFDVL